MIAFAEYAPDRAPYDPTVSDRIVNAIPKANSYGPIPSFIPTMVGLPESPRGYAIVARQDGSFTSYLGTKTALWKFNDASNSWDDISGPTAPYNLNDGENWDFVQFGDNLIATHVNDPVQFVDVEVGTVFGDLAGDPPQASFVMVVGAFLILSGLFGDAKGVAWSGRYRDDVWTNGELSAGGQSFRDGGEITGGVGGQNGGIIFQKDGLRQMTFDATSPYIFFFTKIDYDRGRGCIAPWSIATVNESTFFLDEAGFFRIQQGAITAIGDERVDQFLRRDCQNLSIIQGTADVASKSVYWRYRSNAVSDNEDLGLTDKVLGYNWAVNKWFLAKIDLTWLESAITNGTSLDGLDATGYNLDTLPYSLDSNVWKGGSPIIIGFSKQFEGGFFSGPNMEAQLETADVELNKDGRLEIQGARPITDSMQAEIQIGTKEYTGDSTRWRDVAQQSPRLGICWAKADGRLHRFRGIIPEGAEWSHFSGVDPQELSGSGE